MRRRDRINAEIDRIVREESRRFCRRMRCRLKRELYVPTMDSDEKGRHWEDRIKSACVQRGLHVGPPKGRACDFTVNGMRVQCKAVRMNVGRLEIDNMRGVKARNYERGYFCDEVDVFAVSSEGELYFFPAAVLVSDCATGKLKTAVTAAFAARFKDNWSVFDATYVPPKPPQQLLPI